MLFSVENQRNDGAEAGPPVRYAFHIAQQKLHVALRIVSRSRIACRANSRLPAERLDLEARVVGKAVGSRALVQVVRFLGSVAFDRRAVFRNFLGNTQLGGRDKSVAVAQYGLNFL